MKQIINILIVVLGVLLLYSCEKSCTESVGDDATIIVNTYPFHQLNLHNNFKIHLIQDSASFVEIKGKKNLISNIDITVSDSVLSLRNNNTCTLLKGYHDYHVWIHFSQLDRIFIDGNCDMDSRDTLHFNILFIENKADVSYWDLKLKAYFLDIKLHAIIGELNISGSANYLYLYSSGVNQCFFKNLECQYASVNHSNVGDIHLSVLQRLDLEFCNSGNFYSYSHPLQKFTKSNKACTGIYIEK